jgi:hypothetical protein
MEYDFTRYRTTLNFLKSKRYLNWMKERNPGKDLHHILGSVHSLKFTDYLVVAIDHAHHLNEVEPHKGKWFSKYLPQAMINLQTYAHLELGMSFDEIDEHLPDFEPASIRDFIIHVHSLDMKGIK